MVNRIGFIFHSTYLAGAEIQLYNVVKELSLNFSIKPILIFPSGQNGELLRLARESNFLTVEIPYKIEFPFFYNYNFLEKDTLSQIPKILNMIIELSLDLVIVNTTVLPQLVLSSALAGIKIILYNHGFLETINNLSYDKYKSWIYHNLQFSLAMKVVCCSDYVFKESKKILLKKTIRNMITILNGVQVNKSFRKLNKEYKMIKFAMLCTLEPNKQVDKFIEAAHEMNYLYPNQFKCLIYGDGGSEYTGYLKDLIKQYDLNKVFKIYPKQLNVNIIYENVDVVLVISKVETFSLVCAEALSHGIPVIATKCGGPESMIINEYNGYLISSDSIYQLMDSMSKILKNPTLILSMGNNAFRFAKKNLNIRKTSKEFYNVIQTLCDIKDYSVINKNKKLAEKFLIT